MSVTSSIAGDGVGGRTVMAEMPVTLPPGVSGVKEKQKAPQKQVDEFWKKFTTKAPGKAITVLPKNELAERLAKRKSAKEVCSGITALASYEEAAAACRAKVDKIIKECRRVNQKYRDPHFDLEVDLKTSRRDCLESLSSVKDDSDDSDSDTSCSSIGLPRPRKRRHGFELGKKSGNLVGDLAISQAGGRVDEFGFPDDSPQGRTPGSRFCPRSAKRVGEIFDDPKFYIDGPTANDVRQGRDGDCWLMAALCTLSNKAGLIENICVAHNQDVGVYGFVFHRDGEWVSEIIDDKLYLTKPDYDEAMSGGLNIERILWDDRERPDSEEIYRKTYQSNSGALYFAQCEHPNETWLPLLEKAYAKAHGDYASIEGGYTGEGIEDLTGGVTSGLFTTDILDKEYFWKEELMKVNQQFLFGCSTGVWGRGWGDRKGIMEGHAYSVMKAVEIDGERLVLLKNPWGKGEWTGPWSDGSKEWTPEWLQKVGHRFGDDGAFWISYKDLLRKYQAFDRTRLFGQDWKVTSIWTTLMVPWTLEYHDTKFAFTLARGGPVVLVLSQLDDRYYRGLEGQYKFGLGIRVHKTGESDYLVRAQTAYRMTRSVNVELELEAGEYTVCIKLDAVRRDWIKDVVDVVRDNANNRREKLIRIGLSYDLAHSKAKIIESDEEKAARDAYKKRKKDKQRERIRKMIQEEKERRHWQNVKVVNKQRKRIERRKERQKAKVEKKKAEREKKDLERREAGAREEEKWESERSAAKAQRAAKQEVAEKKAASPPSGGSDDANRGPETETKGDGKDSKSQTSEPPESSVGEDTPTTSAAGEVPGQQETPTPTEAKSEVQPDVNKTPTDTVTENSGGDEISNEQKPAPSEETTQESEQQGATPSENTETPAKQENTDHPEVKSKESKDSKTQSAEVDKKIKRALGIFVGVFEDLQEKLEAMLGGNFQANDEPQGPGHHHPGHHIPHHPSHMHPSFGPPPTGFRPPPPPPPPPPGFTTPPGREMGFIHGGGLPLPPPPRSVIDLDDRDDLSSVTTISELSERELDYHVKDSNRQTRLATIGQQQPLPGAPQTRVPVLEDEFEKDPWNAVAVVGLRVYYKVMEGDKEEQDIVRLRVVRPNPYEMSEEEKEGGDGGEDGGEEDGSDEEKEEGGGEEDKLDEEEKDEAKVLDVDDSARDATSQVVP